MMMKMNSKNLIGILLNLLLVISLLSCEGSAVVDESATISDENFYMEIGSTLIYCYEDIWNQNIAGKPIGTKNLTVDGPMGGTVTITGYTSYDEKLGIATPDLVFSMTAVKYTYTCTGSNNKTWITDVTLTGSTTFKGSFSESYTSLNHQSDNLHIKGSVTYDGTIIRNIDMSGEVRINRSTKTSCNIFGHIVAW